VPGLVAGEQLCKRLRKWQISALNEAQNSYAESATPPGIAILREATGRFALFINGQRVNVLRGQVQLALLACLLDNLGRAVPHKRLFTARS
jgi:hypothetical protein